MRKIKRITSIILAALMVISLFAVVPISASAAEETSTVTWNSFSGTGGMSSGGVTLTTQQAKTRVGENFYKGRGSATFTAPEGSVFTKIELKNCTVVDSLNFPGATVAQTGGYWQQEPWDDEPNWVQYYTVTWTGESSEVTFSGAIYGIQSIVFTLKSVAPPTYTVTWKNEDGSVIDTTTVEYGETPTHADPEKAATAQYNYTFLGWSPAVTAVTGNAEYTATFSSTVNDYTVTWKNGDDVLKTDTVAYGETPVYNGDTPTKTDDSNNIYTFSGWTPAVSAVTGDVTYTATFTSTPAVAKIGDAKYATLQDALDNVPDGGTVTVLQNISNAGTLYADGYVLGGNRTYTVDLGGYTVSGASFSVADGNDVTFTNGTITSASVAIQNAATTTVDTSATVISTVANNAAVYGLTGSNTIINGTVEGNKYGVLLVGTANGTINGSVSGTSRGLYVKGTGTVDVTGTINSGDRGVTVENGATVNINDGAEVTAPYGVVALKDATVNVNEGSEITSSIHAISGNGTSGDGGYEININGGTITATGDQAAIYHPNTGELNISGGTIASDTASAIVVKSGSTEITGGTITSEGGEAVKYDETGSGYAPFEEIVVSGGTFNKPVPADYCANGYAPKDNGNGTYGVGPDTSSPLNPIEKAAADINDGNLFGISSDYLKGTLLGVQKKFTDKIDETTSSQEGAKNMRFIAVLDTDLVQDADDYGFVLAKANNTNKTYAEINYDAIKAGDDRVKTISAKGTYNNVCGTGDYSAYGDPTDDTTDYKYITCAVNNVTDDDKVIARFYYKKDGNTYYAKYAGHNYQYTGCVLQQKHRTALQHRRLIISTSSLVQSAISQAYSNSVITLGIKNSG